MDFRLYADHIQDIYAKYHINLIVNVILALAIVCLTWYAVDLADKKRIIIVPSHLANNIEVQGNAVSPEYIRIMSIHLTNLIYTYTPYNILERYKEFLAYIPAEKWSAVQDKLQRRIDQIAKLKVSESFMVKEFQILDKNTCLISGRTIRWSSGQELATEDIFIKYTYKINDGGFRVEEINLLMLPEYNAILRDSTK